MSKYLEQLRSPYLVVSASSHQVSSDLVGETVVLNLNSGVYYGLNEVGSRIWMLIQQPTTIDHIRDAILQEFDVDEATCVRDILTLLEELKTEGLVEFTHENP
jgi:hypothetical protein